MSLPCIFILSSHNVIALLDNFRFPQGMYCSAEDALFAQTRGAVLRWLGKDIRHTFPLSDLIRHSRSWSSASPFNDDVMKDPSPVPSANTSVEATSSGTSFPDDSSRTSAQAFARALLSVAGKQRVRPLHVSISMHALCDAAFPGKSCHSSDGLTAKEMLDICYVAGASNNVSNTLSAAAICAV